MRLWKKFVMPSGKSGRLWINNTGILDFLCRIPYS